MRKQTIWNEKRKLGIIGEESAKIRTILKAQECYLKALRDEESIKDHALLGRVNNYIGILYTFQDVYEKALSFQKKAVSNFRAINDSIGQAYASRDLGRVYQMLALPDSAIACYLDAISPNTIFR